MHQNILTKNSAYPAAVESAANEWNNVTDSYFNITILQGPGTGNYTYTNTAGSLLTVDGTNIIGFDDFGALFPSPNAANSQQYLAWTTLHTSAVAYDCTDPANWHRPQILEVDIIINPYASFDFLPVTNSQSTSTDFPTTILHEFGHLAGLKHTTANNTAVMWEKVTKSEGQK